MKERKKERKKECITNVILNELTSKLTDNRIQPGRPKRTQRRPTGRGPCPSC